MEVRVITITPERAASLLKRHVALVEHDPKAKNRRIKKQAVERYARDMKSGNWEVNGETIKIGRGGRIVDGQNRLTACVAANESFKTAYVEDVGDEAYKTIDIGVPRTIADGLHIEGHQNSSVLGHTLTLLWRWERGGGRGVMEWNSSPTKQEQWAMLDKYPGVEEYVAKSHRMRDLTSCGVAAAMWFLFARRDSVLADAFFQALMSGANMQEDDPVYVLRERLIRDRTQRPRPGQPNQWELVARAWNATVQGKKLTKLQRGRRDVASMPINSRTRV